MHSGAPSKNTILILSRYISIYSYEGISRNGNATTTPTASSACSALRTESSLNSILYILVEVYTREIESICTDIFGVPRVFWYVVLLHRYSRRTASNYILINSTYRVMRKVAPPGGFSSFFVVTTILLSPRIVLKNSPGTVSR